MEKTDLVQIVDIVVYSWNMSETLESRKGLNTTWWRYLADLDKDEVLAVVDRIVISGRRWPPQPGEIRRLTLEPSRGKVLAPAEAWSHWKFVTSAMQSGKPLGEELPPAIKATVNRIGPNEAAAMYTNGDREVFMRIYEEEYEKAVAELYSI